MSKHKMTGYKRKEHLSPSSACTMATCPRKYFYQSGCSLVRCLEPHPALVFGQAIHASVPFLYEAGTEAFEESFAAFMGVWEGRDELGDQKRNSRVGRVILKNFQEVHTAKGCPWVQETSPQQEALVVEDRVSKQEVPFALDFGLEVPIVGRIDNMYRNRDTGDLWGTEFKTTGRMGTSFLVAFENSPQLITYCLALSALSREKIKGIVLEAIQVAKTSSQILLYPHYISELQMREIVEWYARLWQRILVCERMEDFPKNRAACNPYASHGIVGYNCQFSDLCGMDDWTSLKDMYVVRERKAFRIEEKTDEKA